jgi:hypothetical protein
MPRLWKPLVTFSRPCCPQTSKHAARLSDRHSRGGLRRDLFRLRMAHVAVFRAQRLMHPRRSLCSSNIVSPQSCKTIITKPCQATDLSLEHIAASPSSSAPTSVRSQKRPCSSGQAAASTTLSCVSTCDSQDSYHTAVTIVPP